MAKIQRWSVVRDDAEHELIYTYRKLSRTVTLEIDGQTFKLPRGAREEPFRLGEEQAILRIDRKGKASIQMRDGELSEL